MSFHPSRFQYYTIAFALVVFGLGLGVVSFSLDTGQYHNLVTAGSPETVVNIETPSTLYTILIFVAGAIFSAGFTMFFTFPEFDRTGHIKGG